MASLQVTCVNKPNRMSRHEHITHLGGYGWRMTREEVVRSIQIKTNDFFTLVEGKRATVDIVPNSNPPYVRTHADGSWKDNLLALNECPLR